MDKKNAYLSEGDPAKEKTVKKNPVYKPNAQPGKKKKMSVTKKAVLISLSVILAAALFYAGRLVYFGFINPAGAFTAGEAVSESPSPSPSAEPSLSDTSEPSPSPSPSVDPEQAMLSRADMEFLKDTVSILLIGIDENPARAATGRRDFRTDVMLLVTINFKDRKVDMLSIPRDSYADIYGTNEKWKLNGAFMKGGGFTGKGFEYTMKSVSMLLGNIPVNTYAAVQMYGLRDLIDALGGVDYNVDVEVKLNGRVIKKGMQHLTGQQVLDYVRVRKGISTDIGRTERQQKLLLALFTQLQKQDKLTLIPKVFDAMKDQIWTNLTLEQLIALAVFAKNVDPAQIKRHTLKGSYMRAYNAQYYVLDQSSVKKTVKEIFGIDIKTNYKYDINYVRADVGASTAVSNATEFLKKNQSKMTAEQISVLNNLIAKVKNQRKKLPSGISTLKSLTKQLDQKVKEIQKELNQPKPPDEAGPSASPSDSTGPSEVTPSPSPPSSGSPPASEEASDPGASPSSDTSAP